MNSFVFLLLGLHWWYVPSSTEVAQGPSAHDIKISYCQIKYNPETKVAYATFKIFKDDFFDTLKMLKKTSLSSHEAYDFVEERSVVKQYILQSFDLSLNGQKQMLTYRSITEEKIAVLVKFKIENFPSSKVNKVFIRNALLFEKFTQQINMVELFFTRPKKTNLFFDVEDPSKELKVQN